MPPRIEIITDTTCDIPQALIERYQITVLPYLLIWNGQEYRDRETLLPQEFYRRLAVEKELPTTAFAPVSSFAGLYQRAWERGADEILVMPVSGTFSGATGSARQAASQVNIPVHVYDTRAVSMSLGWQVLAAARAREAGGDLAAMVAAAEVVRERVQLYIGLDTLEYIYRGGRIGNARRLLGNLLNVRPMLYVDHTTGTVEAAGIAHTRRRLIDQMYQRFFERLDTSKPLHVAVLHGMAEEEAQQLEERVRQEYQPCELFTHLTGPVIGIHSGPRAIALCGYGE